MIPAEMRSAMLIDATDYVTASVVEGEYRQTKLTPFRSIFRAMYAQLTLLKMILIYNLHSYRIAVG